MNKYNIFEQIRRSIDIRSEVMRLLPFGRIEGQKYVALNPTRNDSHLGSFKINLSTGQWIDFATDDKGGDIISLRAYLKGVSQYDAVMEILQGNSNIPIP